LFERAVLAAFTLDRVCLFNIYDRAEPHGRSVSAGAGVWETDDLSKAYPRGFTANRNTLFSGSPGKYQRLIGDGECEISSDKH